MDETFSREAIDRNLRSKRRKNTTCPFRVFRNLHLNWIFRKEDQGSILKRAISPRLTLHDSVMRLFVNYGEEPRLVPRKRGRINVRSINQPSYYAYIFFLILDLPWLQMGMLTGAVSIIFFLIFGTLFWSIGGGFSYENLEEELSFRSCIFFTLQTFDNIGYGLLSPNKTRGDIIASFTALLSNFLKIFFGGIILHKLTNPKKLKYTNKFSDYAVWNKNTLSFQKEGYQTGVACLSFRVARTFNQSTLCDSSFQLVYFKTVTDEDGFEKFTFQELNFEINKQLGRSRDISFSLPLLGLPWTVIHPIDKNSPFYGLSLRDVEKENGEIIGILEGSDEISSKYYQARWSYKTCDIREGHEFVPCVKRNDSGFFSLDFRRLSKTRRIIPGNDPESVTRLWKIVQRMGKGLKSTKKSLRKIGGSFKRLDSQNSRSASSSRGQIIFDSFIQSSLEKEVTETSKLTRAKGRSTRAISSPFPRNASSNYSIRGSFLENALREMMEDFPSPSFTLSEKYVTHSLPLTRLQSNNSAVNEFLTVNGQSDGMPLKTNTVAEVNFAGLRRRHAQHKSSEPSGYSLRRSPKSSIPSLEGSPEQDYVAKLKE